MLITPFTHSIPPIRLHNKSPEDLHTWRSLKRLLAFAVFCQISRIKNGSGWNVFSVFPKAFGKSWITGGVCGGSCGLIRIKAIVRCSRFDLPAALSPPAGPALNCNDGSGEQEAKVLAFFFFFFRSSRAFQRITSFYTLSISSVASVWIFRVHWIFLLWPHRKKTIKPPPLFCILRRRQYIGGYYVSSPLRPVMWLSRACEHKVTENFPPHPPPPPRTSCPSPPALVRMRSLSLSPARRGWVIRQRQGIKPCGAHGKVQR